VRRRVFNISSAASLLLAVASILIWAQSYWTTQFIGWTGPDRFYGILSMGGLLRFEGATYTDGALGWNHVSYSTPQSNPPGLWGEVRTRDRRGGRLTDMGIAYARIDYNFDGRKVRHAVYLPHWAVAASLLILPAIWLRKRLRHTHLPGFCKQCGYDLRASTERCPECGTAIDPAPAAEIRGTTDTHR
jgi:hypothetical protein